MEDVASHSRAKQSKDELSRQYLLWVDGAGVYLLCLSDEVTIGGVRNDSNRADIRLLSNLSRKHLTLTRSNGTYHLTAHDSVNLKNPQQSLNENETTVLGESAEWRMGDEVEIRFRQPTVLSLTAVLDFQSSHRPLAGQPPSAVDRVILMDKNCLIGPGGDRHVELNDCQEGVILYQNKNQLWCKSKNPFSKNDQPSGTACEIQSGDIITGRDFRFRLEAVTANAE